MNFRAAGSALLLGGFFVMAVASTMTHPPQLGTGAFVYHQETESEIGDSLYVDLVNGQRMPYQSLYHGKPKAPKGFYLIDGVQYPDSAILGIRKERSYVGRYGDWDVTRFVHGKINLYVHQSVYEVKTTQNGYTKTSERTSTFHFYQEGDFGKIIMLDNAEQAATLVQSCPEAYAMVHEKKTKDLRKLIKSDRGYLNKVFTLYNSDCGKLSD